MTIRDLLVHIDQTQAAQVRLEAGLKLTEHFGAHLTALYLRPSRSCAVRQAFTCRPTWCGSICAMPKPRPSRCSKQHFRRRSGAEWNWKRGLKQARSTGCRRSWHGWRNADLIVVGEPRPEEGGMDEVALVEAAFMDTGRPGAGGALCGGSGIAAERILVAWDGSRNSAANTTRVSQHNNGF